MEFVFEFLFQIVFEFVGEFLVELGFRGTAAVLRSRIGRYALFAVGGFGFGVWWGDHLSDLGHRPRLFWVSLAFAAIAAAGAIYRQRQREPRTGPDSLVLPWEWSADRLWGFVVLNGAIALGIATGWTPPVVS